MCTIRICARKELRSLLLGLVSLCWFPPFCIFLHVNIHACSRKRSCTGCMYHGCNVHTPATVSLCLVVCVGITLSGRLCSVCIHTLVISLKTMFVNMCLSVFFFIFGCRTAMKQACCGCHIMHTNVCYIVWNPWIPFLPIPGSVVVGFLVMSFPLFVGFLFLVTLCNSYCTWIFHSVPAFLWHVVLCYGMYHATTGLLRHVPALLCTALLQHVTLACSACLREHVYHFYNRPPPTKTNDSWHFWIDLICTKVFCCVFVFIINFFSDFFIFFCGCLYSFCRG